MWDSLPEQLFDHSYRSITDRVAAGGIQDAEHEFIFKFLSYCAGGFVAIQKLCSLTLKSTQVMAGGCVIDEFVLQRGFAEVAHGAFHQPFVYIGTA